MSDLTERLQRTIRRGGPLPMAEYMALALTDPKDGYYMKADPLGVAGDFITAPEVSQMFGEMIGLWCLAAWQAMGAPASFHLVELGPGRGTLMADILRTAKLLPDFADGVNVVLVEVSPALRQKQAAALAAFKLDDALTWSDDPANLPSGPRIIIANEFFDALPVRQFEKSEAGWCERLVGLDPKGAFALTRAAPHPRADLLLPADLFDAPVGSVVELGSAAQAHAAALGASLAVAPGHLLIIDYGRLRPQLGASLQAVKNHARHDPLSDPGQADLTADVDFATISQALEEAGLLLQGPTHQGLFLKELGIETRAENLSAGKSDETREKISADLHRLIDPSAMGEHFIVLSAHSAACNPTPGFSSLGAVT